jgi:hypothetical protein
MGESKAGVAGKDMQYGISLVKEMSDGQPSNTPWMVWSKSSNSFSSRTKVRGSKMIMGLGLDITTTLDKVFWHICEVNWHLWSRLGLV